MSEKAESMERFLRNEISYLREERDSLRSKVQLLLDSFVWSEEGLFTFPDGETWPCRTRIGGE